MAPNKKKKKPASNPARGFATVSVPSKQKAPEPSEPLPSASPPDSRCLATEDGKSNTAQTPSGVKQTRNLQDLSPEELEKHLEDAELQSLVDKYGTKCKNDSSRMVLKLETEERLLRPQATPLNLSDWLTSEILDTVLEKERIEEENFVEPSLKHDMNETAKIAAEEDMSIKLWTLQQTLLGLGFQESMVGQALSNSLLFYSRDSMSIRDPSWGLDQALEWLAAHADVDELPVYGKAKPKLPDAPEIETTQDPNLPDPTRPSSGTTTPGDHPKPVDEDPKLSADTLDLSSDESDGSIDPDSLVPRYVELQSRLYELQPDLFSNAKKSKKAREAESRPGGTGPAAAKIAKLRKKLASIENDVLFDEHEAQERWQQELEVLRQGTWASRRNGTDKIPSEMPQTKQEQQPIKEEPDTASEEVVSEDDEADLLGGIFGAENDEPLTGPAEVGEPEHSGVKQRDFGKPAGMSPRRILEDACRTRDSACKISYRDLSASSYSNRKAVEVRWSIPQDTSALPPLSDVMYSANKGIISVVMTSISTPTPLQAESYVSCVALFIAFSHSPKDAKVYMKLPPAWRDLWKELADIKKEYDDEADKVALKVIRKHVHEKLSRIDEDIVLSENFRRRNGTPISRPGTPMETKSTGRSDAQLQKLWTERSSTNSFKTMETSRQTLPIWNFKKEILETLSNNQAIIICSETGSGKSTQIPSFILENELLSGRSCKIYVTEPRRISAISLARRVSEELGESKTAVGTNRSLVGYAIRLESKVSSTSRLIFATTGVLVRMLEQPSNFQDITHLVLDEVHERTIDSDFLLIILRRLMRERPDLKLVLMSATLDAQRFSQYLDGAPVLNIPGRAFPVEVKYLEDAVELTHYRPEDDFNVTTDESDEDDTLSGKPATEGTPTDLASTLTGYSKQTRDIVSNYNEYRLDYRLIVTLLLRIATRPDLEQYSKAILVFMPGLAEIRQLNDAILTESFFGKGWVLHTLHSSVASEEQEKAFIVPPKGMRKIVIATNIAETGITIPDITAVIDAGKEKVMRFDERRQLSRLVESFIARANAKQRRGRAGRVQKGLCFHLFTKYRHDKLLSDQQTPEIMRLSLQDLVLRVKICNMGEVEQTLSEAIDPPSSKNIRRAVEALKEVKALTNTEALTPLGRQLAKLPLDVFLGKLIVYGAFFQCLDAAVSIAAILSSKSPFLHAVGSNAHREIARLSFRRGNSDLLTVYNAYLTWKRVRTTPGISEYTFCKKHFLSPQALLNIEDIKMQLVASIVDAGILNLDAAERASLSRSRSSARNRQFFTLPARTDTHSTNDTLLNSLIAWSFYPKLLVRESSSSTAKRPSTHWRNVTNNQTITLHPTSVNHPKHLPSSATSATSPDIIKYLSFYHIMQSAGRAKHPHAHETSAADAFPIALLCGDVEFKMYPGVLAIDGSRMRFSLADWKTMMAVKSLSSRMRDILTQYFRNPARELTDRQRGWVELLQRVFIEAAEKKKLRQR
ncbi:hypothetical protein AJ80_05664 [Polytolypa hystricis UAMH7299]|uniref:RNA helicase n=1 Tax=Polytolypa hystricis (strain UAMH7299) TaxID=1447883 RepID=A0A2B7Y2R6_POLH7|nr:hypothetical protein AJ80_05664 [Polytolypa hystricis UAMH7299]